jgi:pimeloyl-ACP methyl ester carboxylesterase
MQAFGMADDRLDRLARALAASGSLVLVPFIPDQMRLRVSLAAVDDLERAFDLLLSLSRALQTRLFSLSVGSFAALALASRRPEIDEVFVYAGMLSWLGCIEHALSGDEGVDPRLAPAVFINLFDQPSLGLAWLEFARATWRSPHKCDPDHARSVTDRLSKLVPPDFRALFRIGCGVEPGGARLARAAVEHQKHRLERLDARQFLSSVRATTHVIHGPSDSVIPHREGLALHRALPARAKGQLFCARFYGHSATALPPLWPPGPLASDFRTHLGLLRTLAR